MSWPRACSPPGTRRRHLRATDSLRAHLEAQARDPEQSRELLVLVHWDGFSLVEAAELTATSASTIRSRYAKARQQLLQLLAPAGEGG